MGLAIAQSIYSSAHIRSGKEGDVVKIRDIEHSLEECTNALRARQSSSNKHDFVLEQKYKVTNYKNGVAVSMVEEWRPVPKVGPNGETE